MMNLLLASGAESHSEVPFGITLLFSEPKEVDEKALQELLKTYKIRISGLKKVDKMPY